MTRSAVLTGLLVIIAGPTCAQTPSEKPGPQQIEFFEAKISEVMRSGVKADAIILDPGIDFAKQKKDNLRILHELDSLQVFGRPILLSVSRKTVLGETLGIPDAKERDAGTIACVVAGILRGAAIFRVHNVHATSQAVRVIWAVTGNS